jgi:sarcosine oxidase
VERVDVAIVGGGPMGTAAARALSARGRSVILFERFTLGHGNGSAAGTTRNVRLTYHDPVYVRMARHAFEAWRALEADAGVELLRVVGGLDVGDATDTAAAALAAAGERFDRPSPDEVVERWPMLRFPAHSRFLFQADGAVVRSRDALFALARTAAREGADLRDETTVRSIAPAGDGVELETSTGDAVRSAVAILAAGAWNGPLLRSIGVDLPLRPTLEQSTYFEGAPTDLPTVIDWRGSSAEPPYLVPDPFVPGAVKAGIHRSGPPVDPEARSFDPDPVRVRLAASWVDGVLGSPPTLVRSETCLYTLTPDEDFVLDRIGPVIVASPCSGHGFKFTPLIGTVLADLVTEAAPSVPLDRFRLDREGLLRRPPG